MRNGGHVTLDSGQAHGLCKDRSPAVGHRLAVRFAKIRFAGVTSVNGRLAPGQRRAAGGTTFDQHLPTLHAEIDGADEPTRPVMRRDAKRCWSDAATPIVQHRAGKLLKNAPFVDRRKRLDRNPGDLGDGDLLGRRELDRRPVTNPVENVGRTLKDVVVRRPGKVAQQTLIGGGLYPDRKTPAGSIGRSHRSKDRNGLVEQKLFGIAHRSVARTKS